MSTKKTNFANGFDYFCPDCCAFLSVQIRGEDEESVRYCPRCGEAQGCLTGIGPLLYYLNCNRTDPVNFYHAFPPDEPIPHSRTGATPREVKIIIDLVIELKQKKLPVTIEGIAGKSEFHRGIVKKVFEELHITESKEHGMKNIYLCGPVSGREYKEAVDHFDRIEQKIRRSAANFDMQVNTYNPMRFCPQNIVSWHEAMKICISELVLCSGIALLQGWQRSRGAALELKLAQDLRIPVVYIEPPVDLINIKEISIAAPEALRYYNARLTQFCNEGVEGPLAEDRAAAETVSRYLDPYGFEYIEIKEGE